MDGSQDTQRYILLLAVPHTLYMSLKLLVKLLWCVSLVRRSRPWIRLRRVTPSSRKKGHNG